MPEEKNNSTSSDSMIRVDGLISKFGSHVVLDGIDLEVFPGEMMVIMGSSGCGKSVLLRHMIGSMQPDAGQVELFGQNLSHTSEEHMDTLRKRFGILFQSGALFNSMTVGDNIALPLREHTNLDEHTIEIIVKIKLELVGLRHASHLMPAEISGGMKKRAALARAIAMDPELLFYDEPTAGLDPVTSAEIDQLMMDLAGKLGVTSVIVTHEMDSAFRIADRMAMMDSGKLLKIGTKAQFETIRNSQPNNDETHNLILQFLKGDADGPITQRRISSGYEQDILQTTGK